MTGAGQFGGFSTENAVLLILKTFKNYHGKKYFFRKNMGFRRFQISNMTRLEAIRLEKIRISLFRAGLCFKK